MISFEVCQQSLAVVIDASGMSTTKSLKVAKICRGILSMRKLRNTLQHSQNSAMSTMPLVISLIEDPSATKKRGQDENKNTRHKNDWSDNWMSVKNHFQFDRSVMSLTQISLKVYGMNLTKDSTYAARDCQSLQIPKQ